MLSVGTLPAGVNKSAPVVFRANAADRDAWDAYLNAKPRVPPFAIFGWAEILRQCYAVEPVLLAARNGDGRLSGVLFAYRRTGQGGDTLYSPPFGLVADDDAVIRALLGAASDYAASHGMARTILTSGEQSAETPYHGWTKTTLIKPLPNDETAVLDGLRKKTRYTIRRAAQSGIEIRQGFEHLPGFYAAYEARMAEKCLSIHGFSFFEQMAKLLGDRAVLLVATKDSRVLGGMIFLLSAETAAYQFNATFSDALPLGVNHLLMWEAIRDFIGRGITHLDLGESQPGGGVYEFKTIQFGGEPTDVFYYDVTRRAGEPAAPSTPPPLGYRLANRFVPLIPARLRHPFLYQNRRPGRLL